MLTTKSDKISRELMEVAKMNANCRTRIIEPPTALPRKKIAYLLRNMTLFVALGLNRASWSGGEWFLTV